MPTITEKQLDSALHNAFQTDRQFSDWFLSHTKFSGLPCKLIWSRSDHPWGKVKYVSANAEGIVETSFLESETDILLVFEAQDESRFALHIENKLATGKFTRLQPELYSHRAKQWAGNPSYGSYSDFETVLVAPKSFYERNFSAASSFSCYISHEEISAHIPLFAV